MTLQKDFNEPYDKMYFYVNQDVPSILHCDEVIGFKGFNVDMTCRGFKYEIGKTYTMPRNSIDLCHSGFHFCINPFDVLDFYEPSNSIYARVKAEDTIIGGLNEFVTSKITILEKISIKKMILGTKMIWIDNTKNKFIHYDDSFARSTIFNNPYSLHYNMAQIIANKSFINEHVKKV